MPSRVVLLGASNLTMELRRVLALARAEQLFVAAGHGRAYGRWSRVGVRGLPAIVDCQLWAALEAAPPMATRALVTDVGNDLPLGATPAELTSAVATCLRRLAARDAEVVLTLLPAPAIARLAPWQFRIFRTVLFPGCRLTFSLLLARVMETNDRLTDLAAREGARLVAPDPTWYGADAIHVRRNRRHTAWRAMLAGWNPPPEPCPPVICRRLAPAFRTVAGVRLRRAQPCAVLADGTPVSLF
jgi:hypothetical protein